MIPIFDSLAHPTLSGRWHDSGKDASFATLNASLREYGYVGAAAVGISGIEDYADAAFIEECRRYAGLVPVAGFNPMHGGSASDEMRRLRAMGFGSIKIHPRYTGMDLGGPSLGNALIAAGEHGLSVFFCTYQHNALEHYPSEDPFFYLVRALKLAPKTKVLLVHGGDVQLMRYAELVRFNPNLLLDLSLTMLKYAGSSLDADLYFLFRNFNQRICIGTDHPEYGHRELRARFESLASGLSQDKANNIAYRNITDFIGYSCTRAN